MAQSESTHSSTALRLTLLSLVVAGLLLALLTRLWSLQILAGERYAELAESNRVRWVVTEAPRGRLLDRHGDEIVKNRPALTVSADKSRLIDDAGNPRSAEAAAVLDRLSDVLDMTRDEIVERLQTRKYSPFRAIPIREDVAPEVIFAIKEHQELYPGVVAETLPVRTYPRGTVAAHLIGYIGEINERELESWDGDYRLGDLVGKSGLEASYEQWLQGKKGWRKLEVNAHGTVLEELARELPVAGADVRTTLDLDLQETVEELLAQGLEAARFIDRPDNQEVTAPAGAAVVIDVTNGGIVAMASLPTYDPTVFLGGVSPDDWARLSDPENHLPMLNRAVVAAHPPGSTFKPITSAASFAGDMLSPTSRLSCPGSLNIGRRWRNWNPRSEGSLDTVAALMRSCDTFYYQVGHELWQRDEARVSRGEEPLELVENLSRQLGLGRDLGLDLPEERSGTVPGREWKRRFVENLGRDCDGDSPDWECAWRYYDAINASIGQGYVTATPLEMAVAYATIANGGTLWRPHLGFEVVSPEGEVIEGIEPEVLGTVDLEPAEWEAIQDGLTAVVMQPRGTANFRFNGFPLDDIPVAGKTGTAEADGKVPFAWFASYAPADDPRYALAVMVEEGSAGSGAAAPIARRIWEAVFDLDITPYPALVADGAD
ncbi:MAG: penicillin-binding protein 2 [Nitriliruptorales bacterium]